MDSGEQPVPSQISRVAVIGSGVMGRGIAQVSAQAGCDVVLHDLDPTALAAATNQIRSNLNGGIERGKLTKEDRDQALSRLSTTTELGEAMADRDLVVEAVPEDPDLKRRVFAAAAAAAPPEAILATNTSSIQIGELAGSVPRPGRFLGLHFFNPVHIMKLVEVVRGPETDPVVYERAASWVEETGKEAVRVNDAPGFASSRLGVLLGLEAIRMVEQGVADPHDIDRAMELGYRHPMGPLRLTDLVGLDVRLGIAEYLEEALGSPAFSPPALLRRMVEEGKLGQKTGQGFYTWESKGSGR